MTEDRKLIVVSLYLSTPFIFLKNSFPFLVKVGVRTRFRQQPNEISRKFLSKPYKRKDVAIPFKRIDG